MNERDYLKWFFILVPIVAGLDKFFNLLVDWSQYLVSFMPAEFMLFVGIVEIAAGILVFFRPRIGGYLVSVWLVLIAINLVITGYYDIAVRDIGLALAAYVMARMHT